MDTVLPTFATGFCLPEGSEQQLPLVLPGCRGTSWLVAAGGLVLSETRLVADGSRATWQHVNERPVVELNFVLAGQLRQSQSDLLREQPYVPGYHNWVFNPQSVEQNQLLGPGEFRLVTVQVPAARMLDVLTTYAPDLEPLARQLAQHRPWVQQAPAPGLPPRLRYLLATLWDSPEPVGLKRLHYEAVALELVAQQAALWLAPGQAAPPLTAPERDKLHHARALLLRQLSEPPSLAGLARACGLNEFSLKRGFRQLFGTSVGGFVQAQRLDEARHLLLAGDQTVAEIAYQLGYAHPQHFHRAFKKHFGLTPKQLTR